MFHILNNKPFLDLEGDLYVDATVELVLGMP